jgi:RNA polymerase sigma-70 factor (ECF subfamily)
MADSEPGDPSMMISDTLLVQRFREGDLASFEELFLRHYDRVYGLLYRLVGTRHEAEDLTQEVFLRLYRRPLSRPDNVTGWLYRVAMNAGYNALRSENRRFRRERASAPEVEVAPSTEAEVTGRERSRQVRAALATLPPRSAQLLVMRHMGFSYRELAEIVGVAPGSVGTLLNRAGEAFRKAYREEVGEDDAHS